MKIMIFILIYAIIIILFIKLLFVNVLSFGFIPFKYIKIHIICEEFNDMKIIAYDILVLQTCSHYPDNFDHEVKAKL